MADLSHTTNNKTLFYTKRITGIILLLAMAAVFLFSGYSKIYSPNAFDAFQWTFLDLGIKSMTVAGILARLFIGFEFLLGIFLLFHIFLKQFTYPATIAILIVFVGYLCIILIQQGNNGSCGCFGDKVAVKPLTELWHDLLMIAATVLLMFIYPIKPYKNQDWIAMVIGMAALVTPFIINPLSQTNEPQVASQPINLNPLYENNPAPTVELRKGKHIVAFLSLTCPHCKKAAYLLQIIHRDNPDLPIYFVLNGPPSYEQEFFKETHAEQVPQTMLKSVSDFMDMAGPYVPAIYWIDNSIIVRKSSYYQLDPKYMKEWLRK